MIPQRMRARWSEPGGELQVRGLGDGLHVIYAPNASLSGRFVRSLAWLWGHDRARDALSLRSACLDLAAAEGRYRLRRSAGHDRRSIELISESTRLLAPGAIQQPHSDTEGIAPLQPEWDTDLLDPIFIPYFGRPAGMWWCDRPDLRRLLYGFDREPDGPAREPESIVGAASAATVLQALRSQQASWKGINDRLPPAAQAWHEFHQRAAQRRAQWHQLRHEQQQLQQQLGEARRVQQIHRVWQRLESARANAEQRDSSRITRDMFRQLRRQQKELNRLERRCHRLQNRYERLTRAPRSSPSSAPRAWDLGRCDQLLSAFAQLWQPLEQKIAGASNLDVDTHIRHTSPAPLATAADRRRREVRRWVSRWSAARRRVNKWRRESNAPSTTASQPNTEHMNIHGHDGPFATALDWQVGWKFGDPRRSVGGTGRRSRGPRYAAAMSRWRHVGIGTAFVVGASATLAGLLSFSTGPAWFLALPGSAAIALAIILRMKWRHQAAWDAIRHRARQRNWDLATNMLALTPLVEEAVEPGHLREIGPTAAAGEAGRDRPLPPSAACLAAWKRVRRGWRRWLRRHRLPIGSTPRQILQQLGPPPASTRENGTDAGSAEWSRWCHDLAHWRESAQKYLSEQNITPESTADLWSQLQMIGRNERADSGPNRTPDEIRRLGALGDQWRNRRQEAAERLREALTDLGVESLDELSRQIIAARRDARQLARLERQLARLCGPDLAIEQVPSWLEGRSEWVEKGGAPIRRQLKTVARRLAELDSADPDADATLAPPWNDLQQACAQGLHQLAQATKQVAQAMAGEQSGARPQPPSDRQQSEVLRVASQLLAAMTGGDLSELHHRPGEQRLRVCVNGEHARPVDQLDPDAMEPIGLVLRLAMAASVATAWRTGRTGRPGTFDHEGAVPPLVLEDAWFATKSGAAPLVEFLQGMAAAGQPVYVVTTSRDIRDQLESSQFRVCTVRSRRRQRKATPLPAAPVTATSPIPVDRTAEPEALPPVTPAMRTIVERKVLAPTFPQVQPEGAVYRVEGPWVVQACLAGDHMAD